MFVELIGLPGSGKSTIETSFIEKEQSLTCEIVHPIYNLDRDKWLKRNLLRFFSIVRFCIKNKKQVKDSIIFIRKTQQIDFVDNFRLSYQLLHIFSIYEKYNGFKGYVFLDEGLVHIIWAINCKGRNPVLGNELKDFLRKFEYNKSLVVRVDCDKELVHKRISLRNYVNSRLTSIIRNYNFSEKILVEVFSCIDTFEKIVVNTSLIDADSIASELLHHLELLSTCTSKMEDKDEG